LIQAPPHPDLLLNNLFCWISIKSQVAELVCTLHCYQSSVTHCTQSHKKFNTGNCNSFPPNICGYAPCWGVFKIQVFKIPF